MYPRISDIVNPKKEVVIVVYYPKEKPNEDGKYGEWTESEGVITLRSRNKHCEIFPPSWRQTHVRMFLMDTDSSSNENDELIMDTWMYNPDIEYEDGKFIVSSKPTCITARTILFFLNEDENSMSEDPVETWEELIELLEINIVKK